MNIKNLSINLGITLLLFCFYASGCNISNNTNSTISKTDKSSSPTTISSPAAGPVAYPMPSATDITSQWVHVATLSKEIGQRYTYTCPRYNGGPMHEVIGVDQYHTSSPICYAALHAGIITQEGGQVTFEIKPGLTSYATSTRNGVPGRSINVDGYEPTNQLNWSYVFVKP